MTRVNRRLALIPVVAVLGACSSGSTEPQNSTPTTTHYAGVFSSPGATGSFTATAPTPPSGLRLATPSTGRVGSGPSAASPYAVSATTMTVVVTLINPARTFTLTGSVTGTSFSVSDNSSPPNTCTGTIGNELNATCSILGFTNILFLGVVVPAATQGILANYCGFETPTGGGAADAAVFLGIAGASSFISRIALANGAESFYLDQTATATTISDTLLGSTSDYLSGAYTLPNPLPPAVPTTPGTASGTHTSPMSAGTWSASTDGCTVTTASVVPSAVTFTTTVNTTPPTQTVMVQGGSLGPITAIVPQQASSWLTATVSGTTVTLAVTPMATATSAPYTTAVNVYAEFANNGPLPITVTYNVTNVAAPVMAAASGGLAFTWTPGSATPAAQSDQITSTGGTAAGLAVSFTYGTPPAGFTGTQNWLTTAFTPPSPSTPAPWTATVNTTRLVPGEYGASVTVTSTTPNVASLRLGVTLNVVSSTACTITNPLVPGQAYATLDPLTVGTWATIPITTTGCPTPGNYSWFASLPAGLTFPPDEDVIKGTPSGPAGVYSFTLQLISSVPGAVNPVASLPFQGNVSASSGSCVIGPVPGGLPGGTSGSDYDEELWPSTGCVQVGDSAQVYQWTLSGNPAWLTFPQGQTSAMGAAVALLGTAPTVAVPMTYTFTLMFQANQSAVTPNNGNTASSGAITYTLTISP